uniref:SRP72 RNA-binding domain-containing protein n=1 Tax=Tanacetum cinerariifolium TaxID=118510 RepID=A0A699HGZ9_TANCI|nr:SRP72 RNA-binding domain-containing protein [Tanacetum cinerariifolium]
MVAYLTKSDASKGPTQIIDFLNGSYIKYALTVNPDIYVSCIKQFWSTVAIKQVNDITRLQTLVDKKKVVVTEAAIRESMSAKRTSWNEFSSSMVSAVICLSTGDDITAHREVPTVTQELYIPSPTPTIPPSQPPQDIPTTSQVGTSHRVDTSDDTVVDDESNQERMIAELDKDDVVVLMDEKEEDKKVEEAKVDESAQVQGRQAESQAKIYKIDMDHANKVLSMQEDESEPTEPQVPIATLTATPARVAAAPSGRRNGVVIKDLEEESTTSILAETKSKDKGKGILVEEPKPLKKKQHIEMDEEYARKLHAEFNKDIDWDVAIDHVKLKAKEDPTVKRYQAMKRKLQTEAQAQKNMMMYLKNVVGFKLDYFKGMSYDDIRSIFEAKFNSNVDFLLKIKEQTEEEENRALQTINETPAEKATNRRKLNEKVEDLKRHLEIMPDKDDDVYTEATPLARKVPVVDYEIIKLNNKPYYKIIRADGTHQLYISFLNLLKNFDREDLEALWNLVKERLSTSKPKNFSDDFLLTTLGAMFEKPDALAQVWKNQRTIHANFVSGKKVPTLKVYSRPDIECCKTLGRRGKIFSPGEKDEKMYYGQLEEILEFSFTSFKVVLFRVKWFDTSNKGRKFKRSVTRNNITQIFVVDDHDVIHNSNSFGLALSANLNDFDFATLNIDGQSTEVEAPPAMIHVDIGDYIIDDEDDVLYDLADFDNEVLTNSDDDDDEMAAKVARSHGGDGVEEERQGKKGWRREGVHKATINKELKESVKNYGPQEIDLQWDDQKTLNHVGKNHVWFSNYVGELVREFSMRYLSRHDIEEEKNAHIQRGLMRWTSIADNTDNHYAKRYSDNKYNEYPSFLSRLLEGQRLGCFCGCDKKPPPSVEQSDSNEQIKFWLDLKHVHRTAINAKNMTQNTIFNRHGSCSLAVTRYQYEAMIKLLDLGASTPTGVTYAEKEILAMVIKIPSRSKIGEDSGYGGGNGDGRSGSGDVEEQ